jgi:hypothetical protein
MHQPLRSKTDATVPSDAFGRACNESKIYDVLVFVPDPHFAAKRIDLCDRRSGFQVSSFRFLPFAFLLLPLSPRTRLRRQADNISAGVGASQIVIRLDPLDDVGQTGVEHLDLTYKPVKCNRRSRGERKIFDRRLLYVCRIADPSLLHPRIQNVSKSDVVLNVIRPRPPFLLGAVRPDAVLGRQRQAFLPARLADKRPRIKPVRITRHRHVDPRTCARQSADGIGLARRQRVRNRDRVSAVEVLDPANGLSQPRAIRIRSSGRFEICPDVF